ncbi:MAG: hypothetical protein RBS07_03855 [Lentimicrobium sp.]|jgi:tetratricopeptide (TPR) repeat protein|nr:hypothetical protein [Lentimicrobium sp.]
MNTPNNLSSQEWDLIETCLDHNGAQGQAPLLNEKLNQIPDVDRKEAYVKKVREEIEDSIRQSKIREFHKHVLSDKKDSGMKNIANRITKSNAVWYAIAAILVVFFGILWLLKSNSTAEKIFAENFKPDIGLPLKMNTEDANIFYEGMLDYKQENYKHAIDKWQVLQKINPENDTLNYFLGVAHLALGNAAKSLEYLENQEHFRQSIFKEDATYYAALAKIKEGTMEEARIFLQKYPSKKNTDLLNELHEH